MFEAYSVGITLRLNNLVSAGLLAIGSELKAADALTVALKTSLKSLSADAASLKAIANAAGLSANALQKATNQATLLNGQLAALRVHAASIPTIAPHGLGGAASGWPAGTGAWAAAGATAGQGGGAGSGAGGGGGRRGGGGGGSAGGNWHNAGLHGGNIHMGPGGIGVGGVGFGVGGAIVPLAVGAGIAYAGHSFYQAAKDYETAYTRFKTLNLGDEVNKQASTFARGSHTFGVASKDMLETVRESVGMFGSMPNALKLSPIIAQLNAANSGLFGGKVGRIDEGAARALMRFNDMRGLTDTTDDFMRGLNLAQRMVTGSGGALRFQDLEQLAKRGGAAFKGLSDEGIMMLGTLAQEQGGASTGTALMSLYQNLIAGRTTKKTMAALQAAGLVTLGEVNTGTVGGKKSTATVISGIKDEKMLRENPAQWLMTYGTEAAKAAGAKTDSEIISFMNKLVSNRTGSNMAANFTTQQLQAMRDFRLTKNAMGAEETVGAWKKSLGGKEAEFTAAWTDFKTEFGLLMLPAFSNILTNAGTFMRGVSSFIADNEKAVGKLVEGIGWLYNHSPLNPIGNAIGAVMDATKGGGKVVAPPGVNPDGSTVGFGTNGGGAAFGNPHIRSAPPQMLQVDTTLNLDGKTIGKAVSTYQAKELSRPSTGPRTADGRMSLRAFDINTGG